MTLKTSMESLEQKDRAYLEYSTDLPLLSYKLRVYVLQTITYVSFKAYEVLYVHNFWNPNFCK